MRYVHRLMTALALALGFWAFVGCAVASAAPMVRAPGIAAEDATLTVPVRSPHVNFRLYIGPRYPYGYPYGAPFGFYGDPFYSAPYYPRYVRRCWVGPRTHRVYCRVYRRW